MISTAEKKQFLFIKNNVSSETQLCNLISNIIDLITIFNNYMMLNKIKLIIIEILACNSNSTKGINYV